MFKCRFFWLYKLSKFYKLFHCKLLNRKIFCNSFKCRSVSNLVILYRPIHKLEYNQTNNSIKIGIRTNLGTRISFITSFKKKN